MSYRAVFSFLFALACSNLCAAAAPETSRLKIADMLSSAAPSGIIDNQAFVPSPQARPARSPFVGDLLVSEVSMHTTPADLGAHTVLGKDAQYFPKLRLSFITVDGDLVPVTQDVIRVGSLGEGRSYWDIVVQPGRVWSEPSDGGWSRAAFPFALVNSREGETHNGLATFLYRGHAVSALRYQIVQQTLPGNVEVLFSAYGSTPARSELGPVKDEIALAQRYRAAQRDAVPVRPWAELERQVGADKLAGFASALPASETVLTGLDYHGVFYLHDCASTGGPLPWCDRARWGVWSVTKALLTEVALLRLAQKFGPDVFKEKIVDYVPAVKNYPAWGRVTFNDGINMATGMGNGTAKRDPNDITDGYLDPTYNDWYNAKSRDDKVAALLRTTRAYPWGPGEVVRYRDQDMYLLGVAMDAYLKSKEGPTASLWAMLKHEVYEPIGLYYPTSSRTLEPADDGALLMGFGVYASIGEMVKIARLYHAGGRWGTEQLLYAPRIDELKAGTLPRGLPSGDHSPFGETTYFNTFWQIRYDANEGCKLYIPEMLGWGSNLVALYPGSLTGIRIAHAPSTSGPDDPTPMARVANRLARFCD